MPREGQIYAIYIFSLYALEMSFYLKCECLFVSIFRVSSYTYIHSMILSASFCRIWQDFCGHEAEWKLADTSFCWIWSEDDVIVVVVVAAVLVEQLDKVQDNRPREGYFGVDQCHKDDCNCIQRLNSKLDKPIKKLVALPLRGTLNFGIWIY